MGVFSDSAIGQELNRAITIIALLHNSIMLIYHCVRMKFWSSNVPSGSKINRLSYPTIIAAILYCICTLSILYDLSASFIDCKWQINLGLIMYCCAKISLYYLFLERLISVFNGTSFSFTKFQMYVGRISLSLWMCILILVIIQNGDGERSKDGAMYQCVTNYPFWLNLLAACGDAIICSIISISFAHRLLRSEVEYYNTNNHNVDTQTLTLIETQPLNQISLERIARKSITLTFVALITTPISLICAAVFGLSPLWTTFDSMVNVWCVILMFGANHWLFDQICGYLESKISNQCLSWCAFDVCCNDQQDDIDVSSAELEASIAK